MRVKMLLAGLLSITASHAVAVDGPILTWNGSCGLGIFFVANSTCNNDCNLVMTQSGVETTADAVNATHSAAYMIPAGVTSWHIAKAGVNITNTLTIDAPTNCEDQ